MIFMPATLAISAWHFANQAMLKAVRLVKHSKNKDLHFWVVRAFPGFLNKLMSKRLAEIHTSKTQQPVEPDLNEITLPRSLRDLQLRPSPFPCLWRSEEDCICCFLTSSQVFPIPRPLLTEFLCSSVDTVFPVSASINDHRTLHFVSWDKRGQCTLCWYRNSQCQGIPLTFQNDILFYLHFMHYCEPSVFMLSWFHISLYSTLS